MSGHHPHYRPSQPPPIYGPPFDGYHAPHPAPKPRAEPSQSVSKLTMPVVMAGSCAVFLVVTTYTATVNFSEIKFALEKLSTKVDGMANQLSDRITRLENDQRDGLTKRDHEIWCAKAERANYSIGWTCAERAEPAPRAPQVNGWQARTR